MQLVIIRTLILFALVVVVMRIMGKRQIGQLQPYELAVTVLIADLAAVPMEDAGRPLIHGVIPIVVLLSCQVTLSFLALKSQKARSVICGTPSVLIENGKIIEDELVKTRYNVNELLEQLRAKDFPDISDVEFAILETSGQLSVIPKSQRRAVVPEDLNIKTEYEGLPVALIIDGVINESNLKRVKQNVPWLKEELHKFGITNLKEVLVAILDTQGRLYFQKKQG